MMATVQAPPSKSLTHRALFCSALAVGESVILNPLLCDDTLTTVSALEVFGVSIQKEKDRWIVHGRPWKIPAGPIDCNESGTTWRFLKAITEALDIPCELTGKPSLLKRPIDGANTSQFLSGRLIAMRECSEPAVSKPYIELTIDVQKKFGVDPRKNRPQQYRPATVEIDGDWSSASFLLAAGVLTKGVVVEGLNPDSLQGDRAIFGILKEMGAEIFWDAHRLVVKPSPLRAISWDFSQTPDLYPVMVVLSLFAKGNCRFTGTERLRFKESDRVAAMEQILTSNVINSTDHRIAMAAAVLNLATGDKRVIKNPRCVAKSFPEFWKTMDVIARPQAEAIQMTQRDCFANARNDNAIMSNTIGKLFRVTSFGESHGPCIGVVVDGCPAGLKLDVEKIARDLARRRPGQGPTTSSRKESDSFQILSGVFNQTTTGAPIGITISNEDVDSSKYEERRFTPRPGHADYTAHVKYGGFEDCRGGGRFSARITAGWTMAGSIAKQILEKIGVVVSANIVEIGGAQNSWNQKIEEAIQQGDSVGGIIEGTALNLPVGLGEPVFGKLDAELSKALFTLPAVKGVEFGDGFASARKLGSKNNDPFEIQNGKIATTTNNSGGILGGLSNGMPLVVRVAFKPIASIAKPQQTIDLRTHQTVELKTEGRFDPCPVPRAVPLVEAMMAIVLCDFALRDQKIPRVFK